MKVSTTLTRLHDICGSFKIRRIRGIRVRIHTRKQYSSNFVYICFVLNFILVCQCVLLHCYMIFYVTQSNVSFKWSFGYFFFGINTFVSITWLDKAHTPKPRTVYTCTMTLYYTLQPLYFCANFACCVCIILEFE